MNNTNTQNKRMRGNTVRKGGEAIGKGTLHGGEAIDKGTLHGGEAIDKGTLHHITWEHIRKSINSNNPLSRIEHSIKYWQSNY